MFPHFKRISAKKLLTVAVFAACIYTLSRITQSVPKHNRTVVQGSNNSVVRVSGQGQSQHADISASEDIRMCEAHTLDGVQVMNGKWQVTRIDPDRVSFSPNVTAHNQSVHIYLFAAYYDNRLIHRSPRLNVLAAVSFNNPLRTARVAFLLRSSYCSIWLANGSILYTELNNLKFDGSYGSSSRAFRSPSGCTTIQCSFTCHMDSQDYQGHVTHVSWSVKPCQLHNKVAVIVPQTEQVADLAVCVPTLYGSLFSDLRELTALIEWLEYYRLVGAHHIFLYNTSLATTTPLNRVLEWYREQGYLSLIHQPPPLPEIPQNQIYRASKLMCRAANADCLYRNMYRYRFLITADLDDVYVARAGGDIKGALVRSLLKYNETSLPQLNIRARHFFMNTGVTKLRSQNNTTMGDERMEVQGNTSAKIDSDQAKGSKEKKEIQEFEFKQNNVPYRLNSWTEGKAELLNSSKTQDSPYFNPNEAEIGIWKVRGIRVASSSNTTGYRQRNGSSDSINHQNAVEAEKRDSSGHNISDVVWSRANLHREKSGLNLHQINSSDVNPLILTHFLHYTPTDYTWRTKAVIVPRLCPAMNNHECLTPRYRLISQTELLLHHYRRSCSQGHSLDAKGEVKVTKRKLTKCKESGSQYDGYMQQYQSVLVERVQNVLYNLNLTSSSYTLNKFTLKK